MIFTNYYEWKEVVQNRDRLLGRSWNVLQWLYRDVAWRVETGGYWLIKTQGAN